MIVEFNLALIKRSFSSGVVGSVPYGCKAILLIVCVYTDTNKRNQSSNEKLEFLLRLGPKSYIEVSLPWE
jgi:hypothetical protein